jgi:hypothetical protein
MTVSAAELPVRPDNRFRITNDCFRFFDVRGERPLSILAGDG